MSRNLIPLSLASTLMAGAVAADVPDVAVDIAPVHSLVARVMDGVGTPNLIIQPGASPHGYSLRPSEAAALQDADLVFWIGKDLTPWLDDAIDTLASGAAVTALLDADETIKLEFREGALFDAHDHGDHEDHDDHDDHAHDDDKDHEDHAHDAHGHKDEEHAHDEDHGDEDHAHGDEDHDDHAQASHDDHDDHAGHDHGAHDPHAWLSPRNAGNWLNLIAAQLSAADPDNAGTYFANATAAKAEFEALTAEVSATLEPLRGGSFVVFHDAYQYFETDFDFPAAGAISIGDASDPSPARIAEVRGRIQSEGVDCVLAEPQFNPGVVKTVLDGTNAKTSVIDPLGAALEPGPALYPQLIRNMASALADCL